MRYLSALLLIAIALAGCKAGGSRSANSSSENAGRAGTQEDYWYCNAGQAETVWNCHEKGDRDPETQQAGRQEGQADPREHPDPG